MWDHCSFIVGKQREMVPTLYYSSRGYWDISRESQDETDAVDYKTAPHWKTRSIYGRQTENSIFEHLSKQSQLTVQGNRGSKINIIKATHLPLI